jgi:hypothetical protein
MNERATIPCASGVLEQAPGALRLLLLANTKGAYRTASAGSARVTRYRPKTTGCRSDRAAADMVQMLAGGPLVSPGAMSRDECLQR